MGSAASSASELLMELPWFCSDTGALFVDDGEFPKASLQFSRILCYGDSLTAGFYANGTCFRPYGNALQEALRAAGFHCDVSICGLSGHRADQMVSELESEYCRDICGKTGKGLARMLDEDGYDLVILMAGTNDFAPNVNLESIKQSVCKLHDACHIRGVPTVMLGAPCNSQIMRMGLSRLLDVWASSQSEVLAFVDPEELIPRKSAACWEPDHVHFSAAGSQALGVALAPTIAQVLSYLGQQPVARAPFAHIPQSPEKKSKSQSLSGSKYTEFMGRPKNVSRGGA